MVIRRTFVTNRGIGIYTQDLKTVCILKEISDQNYILLDLPGDLCEGKEELYHERLVPCFTKTEFFFIIIRQIIWISFLWSFFTLTEDFLNMSFSRTVVGLYLLCFASYLFVEFTFYKGKLLQKRLSGRQIARWQGALNKVINAFEKNGKIPSIEEIKKSKTFFGTRQADWEPIEYAIIIFFLLGISFFTPTILTQIIILPFLVILGIIVCNHYCWGLFRISYVSEPTEYEIDRILALLKFWYSVSYSKAPITTKQ